MSKGSTKYLSCPMCEADVLISENEKIGEEVYCQYCETPLKLRKKKDTEELYLQEDF